MDIGADTLRKLFFIVVVGALVLFILWKLFFSITEGCPSPKEQNTCRFSVQAQALSRVGEGGNLLTLGSKSPFDITCERYYISFEEDHVACGINPVEKDRKHPFTFRGKTDEDKYKELTSDIVHEVFA